MRNCERTLNKAPDTVYGQYLNFLEINTLLHKEDNMRFQCEEMNEESYHNRLEL